MYEQLKAVSIFIYMFGPLGANKIEMISIPLYSGTSIKWTTLGNSLSVAIEVSISTHT